MASFKDKFLKDLEDLSEDEEQLHDIQEERKSDESGSDGD